MKFAIHINGEPVELTEATEESVHIAPINEDEVIVRLGTTNYQIKCSKIDLDSKELALSINNRPFSIELLDEVDLMVEELGMDEVINAHIGDVIAPMPGKVLEIMAKPGDEVDAGSPILVLEAMKMENILKSAGKGVITEIHISEGQTVDKGHLLISIN